MQAEGRSASALNNQAAVFVKAGAEMPADSSAALILWAESSCVGACSLVILMPDSSPGYKNSVATGFWP